MPTTSRRPRRLLILASTIQPGRGGFDRWIVAAREYNEDPVILTLLPEPAMAARRRTILVFARRADGGVDRITLDRYGFGDFYTSGWEPDAEEQDASLARLVRE